MSRLVIAKFRRLHQQSRSNRGPIGHRRSSSKLSRRRISAPESLECRTLLAGDVLAAADLPAGDEISPPNPGLIYVSGTKWEDYNANGLRDRNELGLGGVTIYSDINRDGEFNDGEPHTITQDDGRYDLDLEPGEHYLAEVVPDGFEQTYPHEPRIEFADLDDEFATVEPRSISFDGPSEESLSITIHPLCIRPYELSLEASDERLSFELLPKSELPVINGCGGDTSEFDILLLDAPEGQSTIDFVDQLDGSVLGSVTVTTFGRGQGGHFVRGEFGEATFIEGLDFGNHRDVPGGTVGGRKWLDQNQNGSHDAGESGLGGVTVFADMDGDGRLDRGEPSVETSFDNPETDFDEAGFYSFEDLAPGSYVIREVVPIGYRQTFPAQNIETRTTDEGRFADGSALEMVLDGGTVDLRDAENGMTLDFSVLWNNGCGMLDDESSVATVVGQTVAVELHGYQTGTQCTEALQWQSVSVKVDGGVPERGFQVFTTLHESFVDFETGESTDDIATLVSVSEVRVSQLRGHAIDVVSEGTIDGLDFGNFRLPPGQARGTKWLDVNGDGVRNDNEPGLAGVTIYSDANGNGLFDDDEASTVTLADDPATDVDETGMFVLDDLAIGSHWIHEVIPDGYQQTFPQGFGFFLTPHFPEDAVVPQDDFFFPGPACDDNGDCLTIAPPFFGGGWHDIEIEPGLVVEGLDFGNQKTEPGSIHGTKWLDSNGNGQRDNGEPGLAGVTIYADIDFDGQFSADFEPSTVTMADDPNTLHDEAGAYWLDGLEPRAYVIREVVPDGFVQTFPYDYYFEFPVDLPFVPGMPVDPGMPVEHGIPVEPDFPIGGPEFPFEREFPFEPGFPFDPFEPGIPFPDSNGGHFVYLGVGDVVEGLDFGNREAGPVGIEGRKWQDDNGNGRQDRNEPGLSGVTIYIDANNNRQLDDDEVSTVTSEDDPDTDFDETGYYAFENVAPGQYYVREVVPDGYEQTFPREYGNTLVVEPGYGEPIDPIVVAEYHLLGDPMIEPSGETELLFEIRYGACATLDAASTQVDISDRSIRVEMTMNSEGHEVACDAGIEEILVPVSLPVDLAGGEYRIQSNLLELDSDGTLHESFYIETLAFVESSHSRVVSVNEVLGAVGVDFGNRQINTPVDTIEGRKWQDDNGNGLWDRGEVGLGGVTIFLDANDNGVLDRGEASTVTEFDIPETDFDEAGRYHFAVAAGDYVVREIVPDGFEQTFPAASGGMKILESVSVRPPATHFTGVEEFSLSQPIHEGQGTSELTFIVTTNGCGTGLDFDATEFDVSDGHIAVEMVADIPNDPACDGRLLTEMQTLDFGFLEPGTYELRASIGAHQFGVGDGEEAFIEDAYIIEALLDVGGDASGAHYVSRFGGDALYVESNFGNRPLEVNTAAIVGNVRVEGRAADELGSFEVFLDTNLNGQFDADDVVTEAVPNFLASLLDDEFTYAYEFGGLERGYYVIRMVPSDQYEVVFPNAEVTCRAVYCTPDMHRADLESGQLAERNFVIRLNGVLPTPDGPAVAVWEGDTAHESHAWNDPSNWVVDGNVDELPSESSSMGDDVVFSSGGGRVGLGTDAERMAHSLRFDRGDYELTGSNVTFDVTSGELYVDEHSSARIDAYLYSSESTVTKRGDGVLLVYGGADQILVESGTLGGFGRIDELWLEGGSLAPGASIGEMESTTFIMKSDSTLEIELGPDGSHDLLTSHVAFLGGDLSVQLLDGAVFGDRGTVRSVSVLEATGVVHGKFNGVSDRHVGDGVFYDLSYGSRDVTLDVLTATPGDANGDGRVDTTDLAIWQSNRFALGSWTDGDFSGDGVVDGTDFNLWRENSFEQVIDLPNSDRASRAALAAQAVAVPDRGERPEQSRELTREYRVTNTSLLRRRGLSGHAIRSTQFEPGDSSSAPWVGLVDDLFAEAGHEAF